MFAGIELFELLMNPVYFGVGVPWGRGRAVLVLPGFLGSDDYLLILRGWLRRVGYNAQASGTLFSSGTPLGMIGRLLARVDHISRQHPGRMIIVGHSLGGILGRLLAALRPDVIAHVITLGSAVNGAPREASNPFIANLARALFSHGDPSEAEHELEEMLFTLKPPDDVAMSSLYSRGDAVVDWRACIDSDPRSVAVEVHGSHTGLAWNSEVYRALGTLLATSSS